MSGGAGRLDHCFAFDQRIEAQDGAGNTVASWQEKFTCATGLVNLRGTETVMAARLEGIQPVILRIRACAKSRAVTSDWRARDLRSGQGYNIRTKTLTDNRAYFEMLAHAGAAEG